MLYAITDTSLTAIANAIRSKTGKSDQITPEGMPAEIGAISSGVDESTINSILDRSISGEYRNETLTELGTYAFYSTPNLTSVDFPNVTKGGLYALGNCRSLVNVNLPNIQSMSAGFFYKSDLLQKLDFNVLASISAQAFSGCTSLDTLIIRTLKVCSMVNSNVLNNTKIASGTGYIYVPRSLVSQYKAATNWANYADQIRAIEYYPGITGG